MKCCTVLILTTCYFGLLLLGGLIFRYLEEEAETSRQTGQLDEHHTFLTNHSCVMDDDLEEFVEKLLRAYASGVTATKKIKSPPNWDYASSFFFSTTVVTTIGYGNIAPHTIGGKTFFVFYALLGIPFTAVFLAAVGSKLAIPMKKWRKRPCTRHTKPEKIFKTVLVLIFGYALHIVIPAIVFDKVESWNFGNSIYYCFVTLTSVGFGDFVPGMQGGSFRELYKIFVSLWIISGMAWLALTLNEISEIIKHNIDKTEHDVRSKYSNRGAEVNQTRELEAETKM